MKGGNLISKEKLSIRKDVKKSVHPQNHSRHPYTLNGNKIKI